MTVKNAIEDIQMLFPKLGETELLFELSQAERDFAKETRISPILMGITNPTAGVAWSLDSQAFEVERLEVFNSSGQPISLVDYDLAWEIRANKIYFMKTDGTHATALSSAIASIYLWGSKYPDALTSVTDTFTIPEEYHSALIYKVLERAFARYPQDGMSNGNPVKFRDWQAVQYHRGLYKEKKYEALKERNSSGRSYTTIQFYQHAGDGERARPTKSAVYDAATILTVVS